MKYRFHDVIKPYKAAAFPKPQDYTKQSIKTNFWTHIIQREAMSKYETSTPGKIQIPEVEQVNASLTLITCKNKKPSR